MRILFMGSPAFAVPTLAALCASGHDIVAVYCRAPKPAGRGASLRRVAIHDFALARDLAVRHPQRLTDPSAFEDFADFAPDLAVVVAYGLLLPPTILALPKLGAVNLHASLLPRWRGAAPIERAILAGDSETGISLMQMEAGLDTGPILAEARLAIAPDMTGGALRDELAALAARLLLKALPDLAEGRLTPRPQPASGITYAAKIAPDEARLDWRRPASALHRHILAFAPKPGAWAMLPAGERVKILSAERAPEWDRAASSAAPGDFLDDEGAIACGSGALRLLRLQRESRSALPAAEFRRGLPGAAGARLA